MSNDKKNFHCYVELAIDVFGGKWKPLIMHHIVNSGVIRYGELRRKIGNINERVLTRLLRELEEGHLIQRTVYNELPLKVEYSATKLGKGLVPILDELCEWGKEYNATYDYGTIDFIETYLE